jgi:hypothetical protein
MYVEVGESGERYHAAHIKKRQPVRAACKSINIEK